MDVSSAYSFVVEVIFLLCHWYILKQRRAKNGALWYNGLCVKEGWARALNNYALFSISEITFESVKEMPFDINTIKFT